MTTIDKLHKPGVFRIDEANLLAEHLNETETGIDYADSDSEIWTYKVVWISEDDAQILCIDEHGIELGYL